MALSQTPRISIKYSITVNGERETDRGEWGRRQMEEKKKSESNHCIHDLIYTTI